MNNLANRIKYLREVLNLTQSDFANKIGISRGALANIERGLQTKEPVLKSICNEFKVNLNWLKTGEGDIWESEEEEFDNFLSKLDNYSQAILKMVLEMSEEEKKDFCEFVKREKQIFDMRRELEELKRMKTG